MYVWSSQGQGSWSLCVYSVSVYDFLCVYVYNSVNSDPVSTAQTWNAHLDLHSYPTTYQRHGPFSKQFVLSRSFPNLENGDAVISFSRCYDLL